MMAAYEFMYVTPGIQNLIRENKSFRIDSEIQTGKKYGMQLLDDNLWMHFNAGKISAEEAIDKSKNPGGMVDRMQRDGADGRTGPTTCRSEEDEATGRRRGQPAPAARRRAAGSEAEQQSEQDAAKARGRRPNATKRMSAG